MQRLRNVKAPGHTSTVFELSRCVCGSVIVRLVVLITTRNDVETGFGLVVREVLGLPCLDSMLVHPDVMVNYIGTLLVHDVDILGQ